MLCRQEVKVVLAHDLKDLDIWIIFHNKEIGFHLLKFQFQNFFIGWVWLWIDKTDSDLIIICQYEKYYS